MDAPARLNAAILAGRLRPLLNRLVFYGIDTCRGEFDAKDRVRALLLPSRSFYALATASLERIAPELAGSGLRRAERRGTSERWEGDDGIRLHLEAATQETGDEQDSGILEYATLLTQSLVLDETTAIRVSTIPAQIALWWRAHAKSGLALSDSPWVEDIIELVVRRARILEDVRALPAELRALVAMSASEFVASDAAPWTIDRALPDARATRGITEIVMQRFRRLAALQAA